jgi:hypothetical protein
MYLGNAIAVHDEWKDKFHTAITNNEMLDATAISADNCCELGKWLYGEGKTLFGNLPMHAHCVSAHKTFHQEAGLIAEAINAKNFVEADNMLSAHAHFSITSLALTAAILRLTKDAESSSGFISLAAKLSK